MSAIDAATAGGQLICSFLDLVAWSEGTSTSKLTKNDGYDVIVSGVDGPSIFTLYIDHPFSDGRPPVIVRKATLTSSVLLSTASGRYQILFRYFEAYKLQLSLPDFSPVSQDLIALEMLKEVRATDAILDGDIETAITLCASRWASMPGNNYGQGSHSMQALLAQWALLTHALA